MKTFKTNPDHFGIEKQCVEFARRWLYTHRGLIYDDVKFAADIWDEVSYYLRVSDGKKLPVTNTENGSRHPPKTGDLIIYSKKYLSTGHVSVIVDIDDSAETACLHEQNFDNKYQHPHQERHLPLINHQGKFWLLDNYLIGWKSLREN